MKRLSILPNNRSQKGQSLVEVALFFPIFIIMLAGLVEVANILITQNRVTSATRSSTRFASDGGEDAGMSDVLLNTVTQTLSLDQSVWDVWSVRGKINSTGNGITDWQFTHIYGISNTEGFADVDPDDVQQQVLDELQRDEFGNQQANIASNIEFVGTYAIHDIDSILGLNAVPQLVGFTSVKDLTVMRIVGQSLQATNGCDGFPIAVYEGLRSVTPPGTGSNPYPNNFNYPNPAPQYANFINHTPDVPLRTAGEGDLFKIQNGFGAGNFGWLVWNQYVAPGTTLNGSLAWPGNSRDYTTNAPGQTPPGFPHGVYGFIEYNDASDTEMHIGDWVTGRTGSVNANQVGQILQGHITNNRTLRLIVYNQTAGTGSNGRYLISGFAVFRLKGYHLSQGQGGSWILGEFIRWDDTCGQVTAGP